jgi:hypothetical protein
MLNSHDRPTVPMSTVGLDLVARLQRATAGQFEVLGEIGRGGMGAVFLAHELALDRRVALKVMLPERIQGPDSVKRFLREARTVASLSHPNIVPIHAVHERDGLVYFVMKCIEGRSLADLLRHSGRLSVDVTMSILDQVGAALAYAHDRGVIHRDIKPGNIMIDNQGWAIVMDFGLAKGLGAADLTATGMTVGTPQYMSPEQCSGTDVSPATDQYALGAVAYEMLTGHPPFVADNVATLVKRHLFDAVDPVQRDDCPPQLAMAIGRMLEKSPGRRWPGLAAALEGSGSTDRPPESPVRRQLSSLVSAVGPAQPLAVPTTALSVDTAPMTAVAVPRRRARRAATGMVALLTLAAGVMFALAQMPGVAPAAAAPVLAIATAIVAEPNLPDAANGPAAPTVSLPIRDRVADRDSPAGPQENPPLSTSPSGPVGERVPVGVVSDPDAATTPATGQVRLGTRGLEAVLYVNETAFGAIDRLNLWTVPSGAVRLTIKTEGCTPWDSTITVDPGATARIGYRSPACGN